MERHGNRLHGSGKERESKNQYPVISSESINAEFVGRRYTTRPGVPAESVKSTIKKYILESFSKSTGISNIIKVEWKSVPGGWTGVEEATFILGRM